MANRYNKDESADDAENCSIPSELIQDEMLEKEELPVTTIKIPTKRSHIPRYSSSLRNRIKCIPTLSQRDEINFQNNYTSHPTFHKAEKEDTILHNRDTEAPPRIESLNINIQHQHHQINSIDPPVRRSNPDRVPSNIDKRNSKEYVVPPIPNLPNLDFTIISLSNILDDIQAYINAFEYNYTGSMFFRLKKTGGTSHVYSIFQQITTYGLPIQCVEGVFIGSVLTSGIGNLIIRFPLCFKSKFRQNIYRHIVLVVYCIKEKKWGALGISRRSDLMDKKPIYNSLWELCQEYQVSYERNYHRLLRVYLGHPLPTNFLQDQEIVWKAMKIDMTKEKAEESKAKLQLFLKSFVT
jgi:hypothetical protein